MYERILVPVDGSDPADRAVDHGVLLAETYDAELELLHVVTEGDEEDGTDRGRGESVLATARKLVGERMPVGTRLLGGRPTGSSSTTPPTRAPTSW
jgi:nucleotide-binding universal stress UspA family protein